MTKTAFVTGANRGIGRAVAVALADRGYDVAISARRLDDALRATADAIEGLGRRVLMVPMDLLDPASIDRAADQVQQGFGHLDLLVNNAIYQGADLNQRLLDISFETLERVFLGYLWGPLQLTRRFLPDMAERGQGVVINMSSGAGESDPPVPTDRGGWGYAYGAGKAAVSRLAGLINVEFGARGIRAYTVNPGVVATETLKATIGDQGIAALGGTASPPSVPAEVVAWLAEQDTAGRFTRRTVQAQKLALDQYLTPDWRV